MSNDLGKKVQQIAQMLDQEDMPDNMKELVALLASSLGKNSKEKEKEGDISPNVSEGGDVSQQEHNEGDISAQNDSQDNTGNDKSLGPESSVNPEMINTALRAMDRIKSANDPRVNLLQAIKPFMNARRQKKIGNCIQLLQLTSISKILNDHEK